MDGERATAASLDKRDGREGALVFRWVSKANNTSNADLLLILILQLLYLSSFSKQHQPPPILHQLTHPQNTDIMTGTPGLKAGENFPEGGMLATIAFEDGGSKS